MMKHYAKRTVQIITAAMMMLAAPAMAWGEVVKYISGDKEKSIEATVLTGPNLQSPIPILLIK